MAVVAFIYHRTPAYKTEEYYDVPLQDFKWQIERMIDSGISFIRFSETQQEEYLTSGRHVAVTFDDAHMSNIPAVEYLSTKRITPIVFVVSDWMSEPRPGYMSSLMIRDLTSICEFGGHGQTHTGLTSLNEAELRRELIVSREALQQVIGSTVDTMALPGGAGNLAVIRIAHSCGFRIVGNSHFNINRHANGEVNRLTINRYDEVARPAQLAMASDFFWAKWTARSVVVNAARKLLGDQVYVRLSKNVKRLAYF